MPIRLKHDAEAETLGKFIDAGHPGYAFWGMCAGYLRSVLIVAMLLGVAVYAPDALQAAKSILPALR